LFILAFSKSSRLLDHSLPCDDLLPQEHLVPEQNLPWYKGITRYQWLVLTIASLGWVFDIFEGQIFVASMREAMPALLGALADERMVDKWNALAFASFLLGGAFGGVGFGVLSDKIGRSTTMIVTILFYSLFTCLTAFAQEAWHMVLLRFLVAMGVGGEWAVASAMVAEVMPKRSRPIMSSIFHGSSVFGTILAAAAGAFVVGNPALGESAWRWGFAIGVVPAFLTLFVRWKLKEPEQWVRARELGKADREQRTGQLSHLFHQEHLRNTLVGVSLASIGLVTFWGGHIYGKDALLRLAQQRILVAAGVDADALNAWEQSPDSSLLRDGKMEIVNDNGTLVTMEWDDETLDLAEQAAEAEGGKLLRVTPSPGTPGVQQGNVRVPYRRGGTATIQVGSTEHRVVIPASSEKVNTTRFQKAVLARHKPEMKRAEMLSMLLNTLGGGLGLVLFGTISNRLGRKGAFIFYHAIAFVMMILLFKVLIPGGASALVLSITLPVFGFFTLGMHAGYAVYFPELYPTRLRGTGAGFCFNMGRLATAAAFFGFFLFPVDSVSKALMLSPLYLVGCGVVCFGRETRGQELPE